MPYDPTNNPYIPGDPYSYDLKWMVDQIQAWQDPLDSAERAEASAQAAEADRQQAEAWAVGTIDGDPVTPSDPQYQNYAHYWSVRAGASAIAAADSADEAADYAAHIADPVSGLVTSWLTDHITNPSSPPVDTSLTVGGAAADARVTGNNIYSLFRSNPDFIDLSGVSWTNGKYLKYDGTEAVNGSLKYSDYIEIPAGCPYIVVNRRIYVGSTPYDMTNMVLFYDENYSFQSTGTASYLENVAIVKPLLNSKYIRINAGFTIEPFVRVIFDDSIRYRGYSVVGDDLDNFTDVGAYLIATTAANMPSTKMGSLFVLKTISRWTTQFYAEISTALEKGTVYYRYKDENSGWSSWSECVTLDGVFKWLSDLLGGITALEVTFPASPTVVSASFTFKADTSYRIVAASYPTQSTINIYGNGNTGNFKSIKKWDREITFKNDSTDREIRFYNYSGAAETLTFYIYPYDSYIPDIEKVPRSYVVDKIASRADFSSFTEALLALKDDDRPKTIYVQGGEYDIFQEYADAGVPVYTGSNPAMDYFPYCVWVPKNTHIIGRGHVVLKWAPTEADGLTEPQSKTVSPLNVAASATIENIEIQCKNGRYCIHEDPLGQGEYANALVKYINVKCYKYANDISSGGNEFGYRHTIGFGIDAYTYIEMDGCEFHNEATGRAFYMHDRTTYDGVNISQWTSSNLLVSNCIMDTNGSVCTKLGNSTTTNVHIRLDFIGCYFSGPMNIENESGSSPIKPNSWDVSLKHCNSFTINIADLSNPYPPRIYAW
jgi:hypothetical protein